MSSLSCRDLGFETRTSVRPARGWLTLHHFVGNYFLPVASWIITQCCGETNQKLHKIWSAVHILLAIQCRLPRTQTPHSSPSFHFQKAFDFQPDFFMCFRVHLPLQRRGLNFPPFDPQRLNIWNCRTNLVPHPPPKQHSNKSSLTETHTSPVPFS